MTFDPFDDLATRGYLRNVAGATDPDLVKRLEHRAFAANVLPALQALQSVPQLRYDHVLATNKTLFGSVYPWAGQDRAALAPDLAIGKGGRYDLFAHSGDVSRAVDYGLDMGRNPATMRARPGEVLGTLAYAHPFLETNGRTIMTVHTEMARRANFHIAWQDIQRPAFLTALTAAGRTRPSRERGPPSACLPRPWHRLLRQTLDQVLPLDLQVDQRASRLAKGRVRGLNQFLHTSKVKLRRVPMRLQILLRLGLRVEHQLAEPTRAAEERRNKLSLPAIRSNAPFPRGHIYIGDHTIELCLICRCSFCGHVGDSWQCNRCLLLGDVAHGTGPPTAGIAGSQSCGISAKKAGTSSSQNICARVSSVNDSGSCPGLTAPATASENVRPWSMIDAMQISRGNQTSCAPLSIASTTTLCSVMSANDASTDRRPVTRPVLTTSSDADGMKRPSSIDILR